MTPCSPCLRGESENPPKVRLGLRVTTRAGFFNFVSFVTFCSRIPKQKVTKDTKERRTKNPGAYATGLA